MPTKKRPARKPARRKVANPAARGLGTIERALKKIENEVGEYADHKVAQKAMEALILVVPLKGNTAEWKKDIKEALIRDRGEEDRADITKWVREGKPGIYVRATNLVDYWQFEADLCLIHKGGTDSTHTGEVIVVDKDQVVLSKAMATDGNIESFPVAKIADAIIAAYAFGDTKHGRGEPWIEAPSSHRRY